MSAQPVSNDIQYPAFRQSNARKAPIALIFVALVAPFAPLLAFAPGMRPVGFPLIGWAALIFGGATALIALFLLYLFVWGAFQFVVTPQAVEQRRPSGKFITSWDRAQHRFSSHVTRHYTNGIRTGTTRELVVMSASGTKKIRVGAMSRATFSELIAEINGPATETAEALAALEQVPLPQVFHPNRSPIIRKAIIRGIIAVLLLGLAMYLFVYSFGGGSAAGTAIFAVVVLSLSIIVGVFALVAMRRAGRIPREFRFDRGGVTVDGLPFAFVDAGRVWVTPPTYDRGRRLAIISRSGARQSWKFGAGGESAKVVPDWPNFVTATRAAARDFPRLLAMDLE